MEIKPEPKRKKKLTHPDPRLYPASQTRKRSITKMHIPLHDPFAYWSQCLKNNKQMRKLFAVCENKCEIKKIFLKFLSAGIPNLEAAAFQPPRIIFPPLVSLASLFFSLVFPNRPYNGHYLPCKLFRAIKKKLMYDLSITRSHSPKLGHK